MDLFSSELEVWNYRELKIFFRPSLDGNGRSMAPDFVKILSEVIPRPGGFQTAFEWCAGPGFIGFALLAEGLCEQLVLADINPEALDCAQRTIAENHLQDRVRVYVSDNFASIPESERFDLVVANPPNFFRLNPLGPGFDLLKDDIRPNDPDWRLHRSFYSSVVPFLNDDAVLCIQEILPFATKVFMEYPQTEPYDIRRRPPILDFQEMILQAGLRYREAIVLPMQDPMIRVPAHGRVPYPQYPNSYLISDKPSGAIWKPDDVPCIPADSLLLRSLSETGVPELYLLHESTIKHVLQMNADWAWLFQLLLMIAAPPANGRLNVAMLAVHLGIPVEQVQRALTELRVGGWVTHDSSP